MEYKNCTDCGISKPLWQFISNTGKQLKTCSQCRSRKNKHAKTKRKPKKEKKIKHETMIYINRGDRINQYTKYK